jgi:hypothetical protein
MARDGQVGKSSDIIDENLKKIFQQEVDRDLPDRFTDLIEKLRQSDCDSNKDASGR